MPNVGASSSYPRLFALESADEALDFRELGFKGGFDTRRPPMSVRNLGNVLASNTQFPGYSAIHPGDELLPINEGVHIFCERDGVPPEDGEYSKWNRQVKKKITKLLMPDVSSFSERLKRLRKSRGLSQKDMALVLGVSQSLVAKWETAYKSAPTPSSKALLKLSELAPDGPERQWWRDEAARQAGFMQGNQGSVTSVPLPSVSLFRTIPVIKNPHKLGELGQMDVSEVQENLQLPQNWFAEGGTIRAVQIKDDTISPMIAGDYLAIIDVSRRDPDRLTDCVVAVRTVAGIEARMLRKDKNVYFLQALREGQSIRLLKHDGEDSIVGQVLKWIADAPTRTSKRRTRPS